MRTHRPRLLFGVCLAGLLASVGCQQTRPVDLGPQLDTDGNPRSIALDTPMLRLRTGGRSLAGTLPWFADRNDRTPAAAAGYRLPTIQSSVTITRDRQYSNNGQVRDQYDSTTYRREYREAVR